MAGQVLRLNGRPLEDATLSIGPRNVRTDSNGEFLLTDVPAGGQTYGYDLAGRRTSIGGAFARASLPAALTLATYDANNRLIDWGGTTLSHDANGNLLGFQGKTYTWNSRDQLASVGGAITASFGYDAMGRREGRTVSGTSRQFLYDGLNPIQERSSGVVMANILTGLEIDEFFKRTEGSNDEHYLTDALSSTLRLTDGGAVKLLDYTYEPYGETSADASSTNALQYTGRENDGTGLYYYRARYYDPVLKRFISEDPIGFEGGMNIYSYVSANPVSWTDPYGLFGGSNTYGSGGTICHNPSECANLPVEPSPDGPKISPQPKAPSKRPPTGTNCADMPNFAACMACCKKVSGQIGTTGTLGGTGCAEVCFRKQGITMLPPLMCTVPLEVVPSIWTDFPGL